MRKPLARTSGLGITGAAAQCIEPRSQIIETLGNNMNDALLSLQFASGAQWCGAEGSAAEAFENGGPDDQIGVPVSS